MGGPLQTIQPIQRVPANRVNREGQRYSVYSNFSAAELKAGADVADIAATRDEVLTRDQLYAAHEARIAGGGYSPEVRDKAAALGMTPDGLVRAQGKAYGIPEIESFEPQVNPNRPMAPTVSLKQTTEILESTHGFPKNSAPVLAQRFIGADPQVVTQEIEAMRARNEAAYFTLMNPNSGGRAITKAMSELYPEESSATLSVSERGALNVLGKYESDSVGGYNAVNQIGVKGGHGVLGYSGDFTQMPQHGGRPLTSMSIGEIMNLQTKNNMSNQQWIAAGRLHAVGRYQMIGPTFAMVVKGMGLDPNTRFTPGIQDRMALWLLRNGGGGISQWVGPNSYATAAERNLVASAG